MQKPSSPPPARIEPGGPFPGVENAWGKGSPAPGLLAVGGRLDVDSLLRAYCAGIFPWFSEGQPILWWSPDPRMVLQLDAFRLHRSLRRVLRSFRDQDSCTVRVNSNFAGVIQACAESPRDGGNGTWIVPSMQQAYIALHRAGYAHSVETWIDGELAGGLYCVSIGGAVFGESMFSRRTNASKIALAALVGMCRASGVQWIDCQQNTRHLASLGAAEMSRIDFLARSALAMARPAPHWHFETTHWQLVDV